MSFCNSTLVDAYYQATRPWRRWYCRRAAARGRLPLVVLFYHRVADDAANPWTISTAGFARHLDWLAEHCELVSLAEVQRRVRRQQSCRPAVSITFDDGYADNCLEAVPMLLRRKIPCTYFVTWGNVLRGEPFPHDVARGTCYMPNSPDELRAMADAGIEIGAHGYTHCDLGALSDPELLRREIEFSGRELEGHIGRPVRYFAFPFGHPSNISPTALQAAWNAGYEAVCSAYGGYNFPGNGAFHLQRVHGDEDLARLRNWITIDPRKLRLRPIEWHPESRRREPPPC